MLDDNQRFLSEAKAEEDVSAGIENLKNATNHQTIVILSEAKDLLPQQFPGRRRSWWTTTRDS